MQTKVNLNPFNPDEESQIIFQQVMHELLSHYVTPTAFSRKLNFPSSNTPYTLAYNGIMTTKGKHGHLPEADRPRYVAFYRQQIGEGCNGKVCTVSALFKYPSANDCAGIDLITPIKRKLPTNLLIKLSTYGGGHDFNYCLKEQTYGQDFIKMSYLAASSTDHWLLLMEKVPGIPLSEFIVLLNENPAMITAKSYLKIIVNLLKALRDIHQKHLIHADVKPDNIMIDEAFNIRFIDFGLTRHTLKTYQYVSGTFLYMPPECQPLTRGKSNTQKTDIFGVCLVILELLGQMHRNYLREKWELKRDNNNIAVNEILLGTQGFSVSEIDTIKIMLTSALHADSQIRLDTLPTLIYMCENLLNLHIASVVNTCILFNHTNLQDIMTAHQRGVPILLSDIIEWYTMKIRLAVGNITWCSIALYLYHHLKDEADEYFGNKFFDDAFIKTFITHQLPRHTKWQDTGVAEYCQSLIPKVPQKSIGHASEASEKFNRYFRVNRCLIGKNDDCYQSLQSALEKSSKKFWEDTRKGCHIDDKVKQSLETLISIEKGMDILFDLKHYYGLCDSIHDNFLSIFNETLATLTLDNQGDKLNATQPIRKQLGSASISIKKLEDLAHNGRNIPAFIHWVETQLPLVFKEDLTLMAFDTSVTALNVFANNMESYYLVAPKETTDKKAWEFLIELTQFIFQRDTRVEVFDGLYLLMQGRYGLHEISVSLIKLKKSLTHAGYWDRICRLVKDQIQLSFIEKKGRTKISEIVTLGQRIQLLFDTHQRCGSPLEQRAFDLLVEYLISSRADIDIRLYRELQNKLALAVIKGTQPNLIKAAMDDCRLGKIQEAIRHLEGMTLIPSSISTLFNHTQTISQNNTPDTVMSA